MENRFCVIADKSSGYLSKERRFFETQERAEQHARTLLRNNSERVKRGEGDQLLIVEVKSIVATKNRHPEFVTLKPEEIGDEFERF